MLHHKNVLNDTVLEKYRTAGQIAQTGLAYLTTLINQPNRPTIGELCLLTDSYLSKLLSKCYTTMREKGISHPTLIEINELVAGFAPEITDDKALSYILSVGDVVKVSLGVQIDGYTANVAHSVVVYPEEERAPLVGAKADAVCAAHIATETVVAYLGLALSPEKMPALLRVNGSTEITGLLIRMIVDAVADAYNCVVVPGSKVRRVRRFLAGQAEGIVAEREFKGVVWDESHQEQTLLSKAAGSELIKVVPTKRQSEEASAIPTDDFIVNGGEVFQIDIRMAGIADFGTPGIVTLEEIDHFTGKNGKNEFNCRPTVFIRDYAVSHLLKLKLSRKLLGQVDRQFTVYPFKLAYTLSQFPLTLDDPETIAKFSAEVKLGKLGLAEVQNRHLVKARPVQVAKFVDLKTVVDLANALGRHGVDAAKPVLPGMEVPLPQLGMTSLKLKSLLKNATPVATARECATVVLNNVNDEVMRLTGGQVTAAPAFVHSNYELPLDVAGPIGELIELTKDAKFGIAIKEAKHYKVDFAASDMQLD